MRLGVLGLVILAGVAVPAARAHAPQPLAVTASSAEVGWISFDVRGPAGATVEIREAVGASRPLVARVALPAGSGEVRRAVKWRCERRERSFIATTGGATASVAMTTASCSHRLQMVVAPGRLRPGRRVQVRVTDSWGLGGISARVCARSATRTAGCRVVPLANGKPRQRAPVRLAVAGRWRISLRSRFGQRLTRLVAVRRDARLRVLVTGDSMTYGIFEGMQSQLRGRGAGTVTGDPNPATGITLPPLDWLAHARRIVKSARPDVSVVILGAANDSYPLRTPAGASVDCCEQAWIDAYARRVRRMMRTFLQHGRGLVYWVLLPPHRDAPRETGIRAINRAIRAASAGFSDGVRLVDEISKAVAPDGVFTTSIVYRGVRRVVRRADDGMHLAKYGIRIATSILLRILRRDGLRG